MLYYNMHVLIKKDLKKVADVKRIIFAYGSCSFMKTEEV